MFFASAPAGDQTIFPFGLLIFGAADGPLPIIVVTIPAQTVIADTTLAHPSGSIFEL